MTEVEKREEIDPVFLSYYKAHSTRTQKRHRKELASLRAFVHTQGVELGDLLAECGNWTSLTSELIQSYLDQLTARGLRASTVALPYLTIKRYARLAMETGILSTSSYQSIQAIRRPRAEKSEIPYQSLTSEQVELLLAPPLKRQHRDLAARDALCMALMLLCGLWPKSIVTLNRASLNLQEQTITYYDYHNRLWRLRSLDPRTVALAARYLVTTAPSQTLFPGDPRPDSLAEHHWTERAFQDRVRFLGKKIGLPALLPRDCHHYWEENFSEMAIQSLLASWEGDPPSDEMDGRASTGDLFSEQAALLVSYFRQSGVEIQAIYQKADRLGKLYRRLKNEQRYSVWLKHLKDVMDVAKEMEDLFLSATGEDWSGEK